MAQDIGDPIPSDLDDIKPFPRFPGAQFTTGEEPVFNYGYNTYGFDFSVIPGPVPRVYPAIVVSHIDGNDYEMDVYTNGLGSPPTRIPNPEEDPPNPVRQLQIDGTSSIPEGSWTLVVSVPILDTDTGEQIGTEWNMQVPVWL